MCVEIQPHPEGGDTLVYTDEQGRPIDMGSIPLGGAVFSAGEGLAVRRNRNGQLLIESDDGTYRLFEPTPATPSLLRLSQLGVRNDNQMLKRGKLEIRIMSQAIHNSLVKTGIITQQQARTARRSATSFAKRKGCF